MYKPTEPIRCPKCGAIVKVDLYKILTSNPPCYEWTCPNCGEKGNTKHGDIITFENQIGRETYQTGYATSGYIQKVDEPDPGVGVTTTNATGGYNTINPTPVVKSTATDSKSTACDIPAPKFIQQGWQCPKCGAILAPNQSYCPFCSPSEYGRTNWLGPTCGEWTNTPMSGQYTNPNPSTTISLGDKPKTPVSDNIIFTTHCDNIKATL